MQYQYIPKLEFYNQILFAAGVMRIEVKIETWREVSLLPPPSDWIGGIPLFGDQGLHRRRNPSRTGLYEIHTRGIIAAPPLDTGATGAI